MTAFEFLFWFSLGLLLYVYFGYPALLAVVGWVRPRPVIRGPCRPRVTVVIAAYNEERILEAKIRNTLDLDYPNERLEVLVASDGSTDRTVQVARGHRAAGVRTLDLPRRGKAAALNDAVAQASGEILVFTDANTMLEQDSMMRLLEAFADPAVGGVCGNQKYRPAGSSDVTGREENLYWRYDKAVKALESRSGSIFAADGALYAIRRELYVPIVERALADDLAISARVVLQGRRLIYEPRAVAYEGAPTRGDAEFPRKVRVTNHGLRALFDLKRDLWLSGFYSLKLVSHKLLRSLAPLWLLSLLLSNMILVRAHPMFVVTLAGQIGFYALAAGGWRLRATPVGRWRLLSIPYFYCFVNAAALVGLLSIVRGRRVQQWEPRSGGLTTRAARPSRDVAL